MDNLTNDYYEHGVENADEVNFRSAQKTIGSVAMKYFIFSVLTIVVQLLYSIIMGICIGATGHEEWMEESWFSFSIIIIPLYLVSIPILYLMLRNNESKVPADEKLSLGEMIKFACMSFAITAVFSIVGTLVSSLISTLIGVDVLDNSALQELMMESDSFWRILSVGILAPIFEELVFRKFLIDRICKYGEVMAIILSGVMFGLFHGNFEQFFYATALGMLFAYIYVRTGKIYYTMILHAIINLNSSIIGVFMLKIVNDEKVNELMNNVENLSINDIGGMKDGLAKISIVVVYYLIEVMIWLAGIILFALYTKKIRIEPREMEVPKGRRVEVGLRTAGMILFIIFSLLMFVYNYWSMTMK
ncbi:MAG: CPBP family intramembrane metalloprotease [Lachnospiraceae bacterium]|nr:CPBP family intramembrane metalloprotease [Lachnospiraceae bacterium]